MQGHFKQLNHQQKCRNAENMALNEHFFTAQELQWESMDHGLVLWQLGPCASDNLNFHCFEHAQVSGNDHRVL